MIDIAVPSHTLSRNDFLPTFELWILSQNGIVKCLAYPGWSMAAKESNRSCTRGEGSHNYPTAGQRLLPNQVLGIFSSTFWREHPGALELGILASTTNGGLRETRWVCHISRLISSLEKK